VGVEFPEFKMSTSTATPRQAIANNQAIGTRQTGAGEVDDIKVDERGWQAPPPGDWTLVSPKLKRSPKMTFTPTHSPKTSKWMPRPVQGPQLPSLAEKKVLIKEKIEAVRVAAFRASLARVALPAQETMCKPAPSSPVSAPAPSKTRSLASVKRIRDKRAVSHKRNPAAQAAVALKNANSRASSSVLVVKQVSKEEAAAPVSPRSAPIVVSNPFAPLSESRRGTGAVTVNKQPGSTHLENNAGRLLTVRLKGYEVVAVNFYGFFKSTLGSTFTPQSIGFHCAGDVMMIHLPEGLVESLGAYLVCKIPNMETYLACQAFCRSLCRSIDFPTPKSMEDASIYAPYLAMTLRAGEREAIVRKLSGSVYTKTAMKCLKIGALAGGLLSMPVATAATVAGAPLVVGGGLAFTACAAVTVGVALAVRSALHMFRPDERVKVSHAPLASVNSTARAPEQHPDAIIVRRQLEKKAVDATRPDAARVTGIAVSGQAPTVFAKNQDNTVVALQKRSAALPAPFHPAHREEFCTWALKHWKTIVGDYVKLNTPNEPDEWLDHVLAWIRDSNSSNAAKATYERAARDLHSQGITAHTVLTPSQVYEWTKREVSVKNETILKNSDKAPRQILAATPEFVVLTAPFIKQLTGLVRRSWKPTRRTVYAPGVGSKRLADAMTEEEWENMANLDFDGYDSCQGIQTAEMEIEICKRHGAPSAHLQLMRGNLETHGSSREGVKFNTAYCRNSGDPWTTLFNTTLNAFLMMYVYCRLHECDPRDARVKFFAGGDDAALFYQGPRIGFSTELARLGHPATVKHVEHLHEVEFLSCRLTHTSTGWNFIPMVGKTIGKLGYSVRATTPHKAKQIARGAAQSLYAASSGCPPLRAYLDAVLRVTEGASPTTPQDEPWKMTSQHTGEPTAETWAHLGDIYGWSESLQDTLVARLATVKEAGSVIDSPALEVLIDRDTGRADHIFGRPLDSDTDEGWVKDLTTEGVEPNPGPTSKSKAMVVYTGRRQPAGRQRRQRGPRVPRVGMGPSGTVGSMRNGAFAPVFSDAAGLGSRPFRSMGNNFVTAPAAEGFVIPRSHFGFAGQPQKMADYDVDRGVRVTGCGLFTFPVISGAVSGGLSPGFGAATYWNKLTPSSLDPRLGNIEAIFQFSAIREARMTYVPAVGATTNVQNAFGIAQDAEIPNGIAAPTQTQLLELNTSILVPAWQIATMTYTHTGTKLWECYNAAAEVLDTRVQAYIGATLLGATSGVTYGQFYVEYMVDFYEPSPILPSVD
jgi:hypothetical protein